jgi:HEAT repeat protein
MALVRASKKDAVAEAKTAEASPLSLEDLMQDLCWDEPAPRRRAARALASREDGIPILCEHLQHEPAMSVRSIIITSLIQSHLPAAVENLIRLLRSENTALRNEAIEALQEMPEVGPYMESLLTDPDSDVRIFAVNILAVLPHPKAPEWLRKVILDEPHVNVCAAAVDCLAEIGDADSIAALKQLRLRFGNHPFMSFAIDATIARIGGSQ